MTHGRAVRGVGVVAALTAALLTLNMSQAAAHKHPTPKDLTGPGVVYIESGYHVEIALIEHSVTKAHINVLQRSYDTVLVRGSGFAVDPSAVIVTSGAVVAPDRQAAMNFAVNKIFHEVYPTLQLPTDSLTQEQLGQVPDDYSPENRLRACYQNLTNAAAGGCVIKLTRVVTVYPYVTNQKKDGNLPATVVAPAEGVTADIALLRVPANSMPTVNLVDINPSIFALGVLGFDAIPGKDHLLLDYETHLDKAGGTKFMAPAGQNAAFAKVTPQVLTNGLQGAPVAADLGQVIGFIAAPANQQGQQPSAPPVLITAAAVRAALAAHNLKAIRGPADGPYESAEHKFENKGYAASVPGFKQTIAVYPGHYLASQNLAIATANAKLSPSVAPTVTSSSSHSSGIAWWLWLILAVVVLLAVAAGAALLLRQRRNAAATAASGTPEPHRPRTATAARKAPPLPAGPAHPVPGRPVLDGSGAAATGRDSSSAASRGSAVGVRAEPGRGGGSVAGQSSVAGGAKRAAPQALVFCTNCGGRLAPHHHFCGWCGDPIG